MYYYSISYGPGDPRLNLKGRSGSPILVYGLWDSCKYMYYDSVIIKGHIEPDLTNNPVRLYSCLPFYWPYLNHYSLVNIKSFEKKSELKMIHADQINAIAHHDGL